MVVLLRTQPGPAWANGTTRRQAGRTGLQDTPLDSVLGVAGRYLGAEFHHLTRVPVTGLGGWGQGEVLDNNHLEVSVILP